MGVRHKKRRRESTPAHGKYVENYTVPGHSTTGRRRAREESDDDEIPYDMIYINMIYDTDIILYIPMQGELFVEQFFSLLLYRVQYHIMRYDT